MKRILFFLTVVLAITATAFTVSEVLPIGATLPKATHAMQDVSGKKVTMKELVGKNGLLVMFSCNTCPYVIKNQDRTVEIGNIAQRLNFGVVLLNSNEAQRGDDDSFEAMISYAKDQKYKWSYVVDTNHEVADAFGANRTPEVFLFNKDLKLVYHGAIDDNPSDASAVNQKHLKNALMAVADGKDVPVKETRSVGCTIKRNK